jgi:hypothetical protein
MQDRSSPFAADGIFLRAAVALCWRHFMQEQWTNGRRGGGFPGSRSIEQIETSFTASIELFNARPPLILIEMKKAAPIYLNYRSADVDNLLQK